MIIDTHTRHFHIRTVTPDDKEIYMPLRIETSDVEKAYGTDYVYHDDITKEPLYSYTSEDIQGMMRVTITSHIHYFTETDNSITFCFNENNEASIPAERNATTKPWHERAGPPLVRDMVSITCRTFIRQLLYFSTTV